MDSSQQSYAQLTLTDFQAKCDSQLAASCEGRLYSAGSEAVSIPLTSSLPITTLSVVWCHADMHQDTRLDRGEFTNAMWSIELRNGPSSMRNLIHIRFLMWCLSEQLCCSVRRTQ